MRDAHFRLQYVCHVLRVLEARKGELPANLPPAEQELSGAECWRLLQRALDDASPAAAEAQQTSGKRTPPSMRETWAFVNYLFTTLWQLHDEGSPINEALAPDPFVLSKVDAVLKEAMKGEIVQFLIRTARDFCTNTETADEDSLRERERDESTLYAVGFPRSDFNNVGFQLQAYKVCGQNCYKIAGRRFFLYFRASGKWVIDDEIVPSGAAYAVSTSADLSGKWLTSQGWQKAPGVRTVSSGTPVSPSFTVSGCKGSPDNEQGASSTILENGVYERQPASEKVNGQFQYVLKTPALTARQEQRHLIFSAKSKCWKITPICGEEEGAFLMQDREQVSGDVPTPDAGSWMEIPADACTTVKFAPHRRSVLVAAAPAPPLARETGEEEEDEEDQGSGDNNNNNTHDDDDDDGDDNNNDNDDSMFQQLRLRSWNQGNHESLLFSNKAHVLAFFSRQPDRLREHMNPALLKFLRANKMTVGQDLYDASTKQYRELLSALTNVVRSEEDANELFRQYSLTGDALLKFLAIVMRLRCGIPVILLGECGCGKTFAIKFLAKWLRVRLLVLDVHGGTTEKDVVQVVSDAETLAVETNSEVFVFLDEINACAHLGLITEVLVQRCVFGRRIHEKVSVLAALNPYREMPPTTTDEDSFVGLRYDRPTELAGDDAGGSSLHTNPFQGKNLVYLVHPVPRSLIQLAFDFGTLQAAEERMYIDSMFDSTLRGGSSSGEAAFPSLWAAISSAHVKTLVVEWTTFAQGFVRKAEGDPSAASLRDAQRCLTLFMWFLGVAENSQNADTAVFAKTLNCAAVALAFAYMYRLSTRELRKRFWDAMRRCTLNSAVNHPAAAKFRKDGYFEAVLASTQRSFCAKFELEPGIAMNESLSENLFVCVVCILNRIPLFLVGKPGTSKTLALQIAASNLLGKNSTRALFRRFPSISVFTYQCSPLSSALEIKKQFQVACRFQTHANEQIVVFVMDEVGLAEFSPTMPLKVLHSILVNPPIAIVGVSNWQLDRAKMNRAILLMRPEPSILDLRFTGDRISKSFDAPPPGGSSGSMSLNEASTTSSPEGTVAWLEGVANAFHELYQDQKDREFWGMRDYYAMVKSLKAAGQVTRDALVLAICRNLGGKPELMPKIIQTFLKHVFPGAA